MLDGTRLAKLGLPVVAVVWDTFESSAKALAKGQDVPDLPIVTVPNFKPEETDEDQAVKARQAVDRILAALGLHEQLEVGSR